MHYFHDIDLSVALFCVTCFLSTVISGKLIYDTINVKNGGKYIDNEGRATHVSIRIWILVHAVPLMYCLLSIYLNPTQYILLTHKFVFAGLRNVDGNDGDDTMIADWTTQKSLRDNNNTFFTCSEPFPPNTDPDKYVGAVKRGILEEECVFYDTGAVQNVFSAFAVMYTFTLFYTSVFISFSVYIFHRRVVISK